MQIKTAVFVDLIDYLSDEEMGLCRGMFPTVSLQLDSFCLVSRERLLAEMLFRSATEKNSPESWRGLRQKLEIAIPLGIAINISY